MMTGVRRIGTSGLLYAGGLLLVLAVVGLVIVPQHAPSFSAGNAGSPVKYSICIAQGGTDAQCDRASGATGGAPIGLARSLYDLLLITSWALLIVGSIVVAVGLIRTWQNKPVAG